MIKHMVNFEKLCTIIPEWKWEELKIGLEKSIISGVDVKAYAIQVLTEVIDQYDEVLKLSIADEDEVWTILNKLCVLKEQEEEKILNKWIFAIIYYVYTYDGDRVFEVIEETYVAFGYTKYIENLISYMPCEDGKTMEDRLGEFIYDGRQRYLN